MGTVSVLSDLYLSTKGRIGRKMWWVYSLVLGVFAFIITLVLSGLFGQSSLDFINSLIIAYPAYALSAKRFQDRNKSGLLGVIGSALFVLATLFVSLGSDPADPNAVGIVGLVFAVAAGIVSIWYLIELGFLRGTIGDNQYGPDPVR